MALIVKPTILIDNDDESTVYIGICRNSGTTQAPTDKEIWEITKITYQDEKINKIEHGINKNNRVNLAWDKRTTYNYI